MAIIAPVLVVAASTGIVERSVVDFDPFHLDGSVLFFSTVWMYATYVDTEHGSPSVTTGPVVDERRAEHPEQFNNAAKEDAAIHPN